MRWDERGSKTPAPRRRRTDDGGHWPRLQGKENFNALTEASEQLASIVKAVIG